MVLLLTMCFIVDDHHKLIRWKMVTHAGIDRSYSRMIVFMKCSTNNEATCTTVYSLFLDAVFVYVGFHQECKQTMEEKIILFPNMCYKTVEPIALV